MTGGTILIAEDDRLSRELLCSYLSGSGYDPLAVTDGSAALRAMNDTVALSILDLGLPGTDGLNVLRTLRRSGTAVPVMILTGRHDEVDRLIAFEAGADDYVTKPFSPREVVCRVDAILRRRTAAQRPAPYRLGNVEIDAAAREIRIGGVRLDLRRREYALLATLLEHPGLVFSREQLIERVWNNDFDGNDRTIDGHIRRIRAKLEPLPDLPFEIATLYGLGYKLSLKAAP